MQAFKRLLGAAGLAAVVAAASAPGAAQAAPSWDYAQVTDAYMSAPAGGTSLRGLGAGYASGWFENMAFLADYHHFTATLANQDVWDVGVDLHNTNDAGDTDFGFLALWTGNKTNPDSSVFGATSSQSLGWKAGLTYRQQILSRFELDLQATHQHFSVGPALNSLEADGVFRMSQHWNLYVGLQHNNDTTRTVTLGLRYYFGAPPIINTEAPKNPKDEDPFSKDWN